MSISSREAFERYLGATMSSRLAVQLFPEKDLRPLNHVHKALRVFSNVAVKPFQ